MNKNSFSKKKLIKDYLIFDWKKYITTYEDLTFIKTKEDAWYHWINYGKHENRVIFCDDDEKEYEGFDWESYVSNYEDLYSIDTKEEAWKHWITHGKVENRVIFCANDEKEYEGFDWESYVSNYEDLYSIDTKEEAWKHWITHGKVENRVIIDQNNENEYEEFDWESYVSNYEDLKAINTKEEAWKHWLIHGKAENRICENILLFDDYKTFQWKTYVTNYEDLSYIKSKQQAWKHFILYGFNEGRKLSDLKKLEEEIYKKIIEIEQDISSDFSENKIYFKKKYTNCGKHFFGWKSSINYLIENASFKDTILNNKYYLDEWVEKLLVWGNKMQSKKCISMIQDHQLQVISFLHGPPFETYNQYKTKKGILLNDLSLLNKHIIQLIHTSKLFDSITFLYVLSLYHKNYILTNYPELKNKIVSVYHPINVYNYKKNDLFDINKFMKNRTFYHIGWWLRNFNTFFNLPLHSNYKKSILVEEEFKESFEKQFQGIDKNIKIVYELKDDEYMKIFTNCCIFCDLADAVANNLVLECIKYNTPIIINRNPSIEEYLGVDYPLFFEHVSDLEKYSDENYIFKKMVDAHKYLKNMDKTAISLDTFVNKITYDISKLKTIEDPYKLTWFYYLNNEEEDFEKYISNFNEQTMNKYCKLLVIHSLSSKAEILETYNSDQIQIIQIEENKDTKYVYEMFFKNCTTEYLTFKKIDSLDSDNTYSELCMHYLDNFPTYDMIIFNYDFSHIELIDTNNIIDETPDDFDMHNIYENVSITSDMSENLSEFNMDNSKFDEEQDALEHPEMNILDENSKFDTDSDSDISKQENNSDLSESIIEEETKLNNYHEELLTHLQINNYDFTDKNILWRKSIHSLVHVFDENFWLQCYKNHFNIIEIKSKVL